MSFIFKQRSYNDFNYIPRYYDPKKEAQELREKRACQELGLGVEGEYIPNIKGQFKKHSYSVQNQKRKSNIRLFVILAILLVIAYYYFINN